MSCAGIVLAAGRSTRFGPENKLLAPVRGRPLASFAAQAVREANLAQRIAVVAQPEVAALFDGFALVHMPASNSGQSDSLRRGLRYAQAHGASRIVICLADMPGISGDIINRVQSLATEDCASAVSDGASRTPPVCIPRSLFSELENARGDLGARHLLAALPQERLLTVSKAAVTDVDRRSDIGSIELP